MANKPDLNTIKQLEVAITQNMRDGHADLKDQLKSHYVSYKAMWAFGGLVVGLAFILCTLYAYITPMLVDRQINGNAKIDQIIDLLQPKQELKHPHTL